MRSLLLLLTTVTAIAIFGCGEPKPPAAPAAPTTGLCTNGALLDSKSVECASAHACILADDAPKCVAANEAEQKETCGMIACGSGCSCVGESKHECLCPLLGPPKK